jgi:hypothetical protein
MRKERLSVTLLICSVPEKCCAPFDPIWLDERLRVLSVCTKKRMNNVMETRRIHAPSFVCRALARCCAPLSPI